jgi:hypothetical protein
MFRFSRKWWVREHFCNMHKEIQLNTKHGILLYRSYVKIRECLQYPEQTAPILSTSGTKHIKEGKCSQPATTA